MKKTYCRLLFAIACAVVAGWNVVPLSAQEQVLSVDSQATSPAENTRLPQLAGTWTITRCVDQGTPVSETTLENSRVVFGEKSVIVLDATKKEIYNARYQLEGEQSPYRIDMVVDLPDQTSMKALGLIELQGETLRLCYALPGAERPEKFASPAGTKNMLIEMRPVETETQTPATNAAPVTSQTRSKVAEQEATGVLVSSNNLVDANVVDAKHEVVGRINQIAVSRDGSAALAIVSVGGVLGVGGDQVAIPLQAIHSEEVVSDGEQANEHSAWLRVDADLRQAPRLETSEHLELTDATWLENNRTFFGVEPSDTSGKREAAAAIGEMLIIDRWVNEEVFGNGGESLAYLDGLILRLDGEPSVPFAILGWGGVLGLGKEFAAIDFAKLQITSTNGAVRFAAALDAEGLLALQKVTPPKYPELRLLSVRQRIDQK